MRKSHRVIEITVYGIEDFITEVKEIGLTKVFRHHSTGRRAVYSAYVDGCLIKCELTVPELLRLERGSGTTMSRYNTDSKWSVSGGGLTLSLTSRKEFVKTLRFLGVSKEDVRTYTSVKVSKLKEIIEAGDPDDETEERTIREKNTRLKKSHGCSWENVRELEVELSVDSSYNPRITYRVTIPEWDSVRSEILERHESPFSSADLRVIDGSIQFLD